MKKKKKKKRVRFGCSCTSRHGCCPHCARGVQVHVRLEKLLGESVFSASQGNNWCMMQEYKIRGQRRNRNKRNLGKMFHSEDINADAAVDANIN